jgi:hypothetical protein
MNASKHSEDTLCARIKSELVSLKNKEISPELKAQNREITLTLHNWISSFKLIAKLAH